MCEPDVAAADADSHPGANPGMTRATSFEVGTARTGAGIAKPLVLHPDKPVEVVVDRSQRQGAVEPAIEAPGTPTAPIVPQPEHRTTDTPLVRITEI